VNHMHEGTPITNCERIFTKAASQGIFTGKNFKVKLECASKG